MRWLKSFGMGLLSEIATIVVIVAVVTAYKAAGTRTAAEIAEFSELAGGLIGGLGGAVMVFLFARWTTRRVPERWVAHGLAVAAGAIVLHLIGLFGAPGGFRPIYAAADLLKLAAGGYAGIISARMAERRMPV